MNLLTLTCSGGLTLEDVADIKEKLAPLEAKLNAEVLVLHGGAQATLTHDPSALHDRLDRLALAIEGLVAVNAALLERLPLPEADEPGGEDAPWPTPLSRPR